jgi:hypothetical protein
MSPHRFVLLTSLSDLPVEAATLFAFSSHAPALIVIDPVIFIAIFANTIFPEIGEKNEYPPVCASVEMAL